MNGHRRWGLSGAQELSGHGCPLSRLGLNDFDRVFMGAAADMVDGLEGAPDQVIGAGVRIEVRPFMQRPGVPALPSVARGHR